MNDKDIEYVINENGRQYVGIEVETKGNKDKVKVHLPIGYSYQKSEKISSKSIMQILKLISKKRNIGLEQEEGENIFPVLLAQRIVENYLQFGLYKEHEEKIDLKSKGRIHWKKTIHYPQPFINNQTIYANLLRSHVDYFVEGQVQEIQKHCLSYISRMIGIFLEFSYPKVHCQYGQNEMKQILQKELKSTNQDYQIETLTMLLDFVSHVNFNKIENHVIGIKYQIFEYVWQELVDVIGCKGISKYLPQANYYDMNGKVMSKVNPLLPDTIVEKEADVFVLDAKYYRKESLPDQKDIFKQVRYGEYVYHSSGGKRVINAFILPNCLKGEKKVVVTGYAMLENGTEFEEKERKSYEKVLVCYVDTKSLIEKPEEMMEMVLVELEDWANRII